MTTDGYDMCPKCGHHTSAFSGSCTVMVVGPDQELLGYCGCDCYKALHGESLLEMMARAIHGSKETPND